MPVQDQKQKDFLRKYQNINRKMEEDETAARAKNLGLQYLDLSNFPVDLSAISLWSKQQAEDAQSIVFFKDGNDIKIGSVDPHNELLLAHMQEFKVKKLNPVVYLISPASFKQMLYFYEKVAKVEDVHEEHVEIQPGTDYKAALKDVEAKTDGTVPATKLLATVFGAGDQVKASDIHVEPEENFIKVRLRIDGVLTDVCHLPKIYQKSLISRIKVLSKMKLNVENVPQDGRLSYYKVKTPVDVRVSILPSAYGESIVMRILGTQAVSLKLDDLGFVGRSYEIIKNELMKPNGMIITTGPTGSGKTTTLYAFLNQLNEPGVKIITLEDPVEYKLEGITQTPIDSRAGLTFAAGLRAILRQDPDVVMVGEIRDQETAEVALQAALTGHVVLSTLHTNDAAGAIPRLINMGVKPFVIAPGMNAIIAQRLVRRLCADCKEEQKLEPSVLDKVKKVFAAIPKKAEVELPKDLKFYHSKGCEKCGGLGYSGRIGIYEVIAKNDQLDKLIMSSAPTSEIRQSAIEQGMVTMMQDGLLKALRGITDVEEVFRVTVE